jgi:hypothetical protein
MGPDRGLGYRISTGPSMRGIMGSDKFHNLRLGSRNTIQNVDSISGLSQESKMGGEVTQLRCLPGDLDSSNLVSNKHEMCQCLNQIVEMALGVYPTGQCQSH